MLWLLLTGKVPSVDEVRGLSAELASKGKLPDYLEKIIDSFPKTLRECGAPLPSFNLTTHVLPRMLTHAAPLYAALRPQTP